MAPLWRPQAQLPTHDQRQGLSTQHLAHVLDIHHHLTVSRAPFGRFVAHM